MSLPSVAARRAHLASAHQAPAPRPEIQATVGCVSRAAWRSPQREYARAPPGGRRESDRDGGVPSRRPRSQRRSSDFRTGAPHSRPMAPESPEASPRRPFGSGDGIRTARLRDRLPDLQSAALVHSSRKNATDAVFSVPGSGGTQAAVSGFGQLHQRPRRQYHAHLVL